MERLIGIIKINTQALDDEHEDLRRFSDWGYNGIYYHIPKVSVLKRVVNKGHEFVQKPLLFNYGFLEMPIEYMRNPGILSELRVISRLIQGYFRKSEEDLNLEMENAEKDGLARYQPVLIKSITAEELQRLVEIAMEINVYDTVQELSPGSYIVLKGYPFEGLGAEVIEKSSGGNIKVRLIESGMIVRLQPDNIFYSPYNELDT